MDENTLDKPYIFIKDSELLYGSQGREAKVITEAEEVVKSIKEYGRQINENKTKVCDRSKMTSDDITEIAACADKVFEAFKYGPLKWRPFMDNDGKSSGENIKERQKCTNPECADTAKSAGHAQIYVGETDVAKAEYDAEVSSKRDVEGGFNTGIRGSVDLNVMNCQKKLEVNAKARATASYVKERRRGKNPEVAVTAKSEGQAQISFGEKNVASAEYDAECKGTFKSFRRDPIKDRSSENTQEMVKEREIKTDGSVGIRGSANLKSSGRKKKFEGSAKAEASASYIQERRRGKNPEFADTAKSAGHAQICVGETDVAKAEYGAELSRHYKSYRRDPNEDSSFESSQEKVIEREVKGGINTDIRGSVDLNVMNCQKKLEVNAKARATASYVKERRRGKNPEVAVTAKSEGQAQISFGEKNVASAKYDAECKRTYKSYRRNPIEDISLENTQEKVKEREIKGDVSAGIKGSADLNLFGRKKKLEATAKAKASASYKKERRRGRNPEISVTARSEGLAQLTFGEKNTASAEYDAEIKGTVKLSKSDESSVGAIRKKVLKREVECSVEAGARGSATLNIFNCKKKLEAKAAASASIKVGFEKSQTDFEDVSSSKSGYNRHIKVLEREIEGHLNGNVKGSAEFDIFNHKKKAAIEAEASVRAKASFSVADVNFEKGPKHIQGHAKLLHAEAKGQTTMKAKASLDKLYIEMQARAEGKANFKLLEANCVLEAKKGKDGGLHVPGINGKFAEAKVKGIAKFKINGNINDKNIDKGAEISGEASFCGGKLMALQAEATMEKHYGNSVNAKAEVCGVEANVCNAEMIGRKEGNTAEVSTEMKGVQLNAGNANVTGIDNRKVASAKARTGVDVNVGNINATGLGQTGVNAEADGTVGMNMFNMSVGIARETGISVSSKCSMFNINLTAGPPKVNFCPSAFNIGIPFFSGSCGGGGDGGGGGGGDGDDGDAGGGSAAGGGGNDVGGRSRDISDSNQIVQTRNGGNKTISVEKAEQSNEKLSRYRSLDEHKNCYNQTDGDIIEEGYESDRTTVGTIGKPSFHPSTKAVSNYSNNGMTALYAQEYSSIQDENMNGNESSAICNQNEDTSDINEDVVNESDLNQIGSLSTKSSLKRRKTFGINHGYDSVQDYNMYELNEYGLYEDNSEDAVDIIGSDTHDFEKASGNIDETMLSAPCYHDQSNSSCTQVNVMYTHDLSTVHEEMYDAQEYEAYCNNTQNMEDESLSKYTESNNVLAEKNNSEYIQQFKENTSGTSRDQTTVETAQEYIHEYNIDSGQTVEIDDDIGLNTSQSNSKITKSSRSFQQFGPDLSCSTFEEGCTNDDCSLLDDDALKMNEERYDSDNCLYSSDRLREANSKTDGTFDSRNLTEEDNLTFRHCTSEKNFVESFALVEDGSIIPAKDDNALIVIEHDKGDEIVEELNVEEVATGQLFTERMFMQDTDGKNRTPTGKYVLESELDKIDKVKTSKRSTGKHSIDTRENLHDKVEFNKYLANLVSKDIEKLEDQDDCIASSVKKSQNESMQTLWQDKERLKSALIRKYTGKDDLVRDTFGKRIKSRSKTGNSDDNPSGNVVESKISKEKMASKKPFGANKNIHTIFTLDGTDDRPIKYLKNNVACFGD